MSSRDKGTKQRGERQTVPRAEDPQVKTAAEISEFVSKIANRVLKKKVVDAIHKIREERSSGYNEIIRKIAVYFEVPQFEDLRLGPPSLFPELKELIDFESKFDYFIFTYFEGNNVITLYSLEQDFCSYMGVHSFEDFKMGNIFSFPQIQEKFSRNIQEVPKLSKEEIFRLLKEFLSKEKSSSLILIEESFLRSLMNGKKGDTKDLCVRFNDISKCIKYFKSSRPLVKSENSNVVIKKNEVEMPPIVPPPALPTEKVYLRNFIDFIGYALSLLEGRKISHVAQMLRDDIQQNDDLYPLLSFLFLIFKHEINIEKEMKVQLNLFGSRINNHKDKSDLFAISLGYRTDDFITDFQSRKTNLKLWSLVLLSVKVLVGTPLFQVEIVEKIKTKIENGISINKVTDEIFSEFSTTTTTTTFTTTTTTLHSREQDQHQQTQDTKEKKPTTVIVKTSSK